MAKKDKEVVETTEEMDTEHTEQRVYELGFHIDSELTADDARKVYDGIKAVAEKAGTLIAEGEPRKIQLAYTVSRQETSGRKDFDTSNFSWIAYETDGAGHEAVVEAAKSDSRIFRFLDIRTTKDEARHSAELQELLSKTPDPETSEEEVSDTELDEALKEVVA
jgi:ribosomal protein S6